jgi:ATP-dependent RNA helicase DHX57
MPVPPVVGKLMVMGSILGCRTASITVAAGMSVGRSPWMHVSRKRQGPEDKELATQLEERRKLLERVGNSDHALLAAAFMKWEQEGGDGPKRRFCELLGLSAHGMREINEQAKKLKSSLAFAGFGPSAEADRNNHSWRIVHASTVAALAPAQLVRVERPAARYEETAHGAAAKAAASKELKFFVRSSLGTGDTILSGRREEQVFIHPSSACFGTGDFSCPWLVYHSMIQTTKPYLRDVTECSIYGLLLFGGKMEVQATSDTIVIDNVVCLKANGRIGALIGGLRRRLDCLLAEKIRNPALELSHTNEMMLVAKLLRTDGLDTC